MLWPDLTNPRTHHADGQHPGGQDAALPTRRACRERAETEIIIARNGRPAARLVPLAARPVGRRIGIAAGRFRVPESIDESNALVERLFSGDPST